MTELVYGSGAAARIAGVDPSTIRKWQRRKIVASTQENGRTAYAKADLVALRQPGVIESADAVAVEVNGPATDDLLSIAAAAKVLGIDVESVKRAMSDRLPWVRDGRGQRRLTPEAVEAYRVARETLPSYQVTEADLDVEVEEPADIQDADAQDERAWRLLQLGLSHACLLREVEPATARQMLGHLSPDELLDLVTLLAACVDIERSPSVLTSWVRMRPTVQAVA